MCRYEEAFIATKFDKLWNSLHILSQNALRNKHDGHEARTRSSRSRRVHHLLLPQLILVARLSEREDWKPQSLTEKMPLTSKENVPLSRCVPIFSKRHGVHQQHPSALNLIQTLSTPQRNAKSHRILQWPLRSAKRTHRLLMSWSSSKTMDQARRVCGFFAETWVII